MLLADARKAVSRRGRRDRPRRLPGPPGGEGAAKQEKSMAHIREGFTVDEASADSSITVS